MDSRCHQSALPPLGHRSPVLAAAGENREGQVQRREPAGGGAGLVASWGAGSSPASHFSATTDRQMDRWTDRLLSSRGLHSSSVPWAGCLEEARLLCRPSRELPTGGEIKGEAQPSPVVQEQHRTLDGIMNSRGNPEAREWGINEYYQNIGVESKGRFGQWKWHLS